VRESVFKILFFNGIYTLINIENENKVLTYHRTLIGTYKYMMTINTFNPDSA
jgi:hypothetical protein